MGDFVHLHLHTQYSLLDGAIRIKDLFPRAKELGYDAVAITDHGNMFGVLKFYQAARQHGIKPIIGCEMYIAPGSRFDKRSSKGGADAAYHIVLLARDITGYKNLIKLVTIGYLEGFYYKPRIDLEVLKDHAEGLIGLSACLKGEIPQKLLSGNIEGAKEALYRYLDIFGKENFYVEIMRHGLDDEERANPGLIELARREKVGIVATNDCHYLFPEDAEAHDVLLCVQTGKRITDANRMRMDTDQLYFKSPEQMCELFADLPEAIENTLAVAQRCDLELVLGEPKLPVYRVPEGYTLESYLRKLAFEGLEERRASGELASDIPYEKYVERLEYELDVINRMGFPGYFLIVWDFVNYAKRNGIPVGPGRGSAAGSLVSYTLGITDIDPLRWGLLFERFLNPERVSMPDIDIDFCKERRDLVIEYVRKRYGERNVAKILAVGTLATRAAVRDVGRALGFSPSEVDRIAKLFPQSPDMTVEDAIALEPRIRELMEKDPKVKKLVEIAGRIEGLCRQASTHAAGIVITPEELTEYVPLYKNEKENEITTQYDKDDLEALGLLKMDMLGLRTLTVIDTALRLIEAYRGEKVDLKHLPLEDEKTYQLLQSGKTLGVFQLESSGMRELLKRLKPSRFEDLIALVALYRPGPLGSGMVDEFIDRKHGRKPIEYDLPQLEPILAETYGVILYQEQVMRIASEIAGFTMGQADVLRKAMGKKKKDVMAQMRDKFVEGAVVRGVPREKAEELFDRMAKFAEYGFNKSHSAAYAMVAYQTAYLKAHYPVEFMAALISSEINNTEKIYLYLQECRDMGIEVYPPDINESHVIFRVDGSSLRFGLAAIKGVGEAAAEAIVNARKDGPFEDFYDFCKRVAGHKVNRKTIEALIKSGALDRFGDRNALLASLDLFMDAASRATKTAGRQMSLFDLAGAEEEKPELMDAVPATVKERLAMEKEALGFYLSGHPLDAFEDVLVQYSVDTTASLEEREDGEEVLLAGMVVSIKEITTRNGDRMAFVGFEDRYGRTEIIVFPDVYKSTDMIFALDEPILVKGVVTTDAANDQKKLVAIGAWRLQEGEEAVKGSLKEKEEKGTYLLSMKEPVDPSLIRWLAEEAKRRSGGIPLFVEVENGIYRVVVDTGVKVDPSFKAVMAAKGLKVSIVSGVGHGEAAGV